MMIWAFAFKLGWFPVGKFLDPLVWRGADVSANYVFGNMLLSAAAFITFALLVMLCLKRFGRRVPSVVAFPIVLGGALVIVAAWALSGIGGLAVDIVKHMVLPVATLTLISFAGTMLLTRNSMLETIREDYVMAARAKGLPDKLVRDRHAARNAMLPIVTSLVYSLIFAIDGSVIIESVFSWPGTGLTLLQAVRSEDLPLVMGAMLFIGMLSLLAHVIVDVLYVYLDPRIRYQ
jgi:peptide/nickel transport system permease protein